MIRKSLNRQKRNVVVGLYRLNFVNLVDHSMMRTFLRLNMIPIKLLLLTLHVLAQPIYKHNCRYHLL